MARAVVALFTAGLLATLWSGGASAAPALAPSSAFKPCGPGYVHANLSWGEKCLRVGQFCKVGNPEYHAYGFDCPPSGHLVSYPGPSRSTVPKAPPKVGIGKTRSARHVETAQAAGVRAVLTYIKATTVIDYFKDSRGHLSPITQTSYKNVRLSVFRAGRLVASRLIPAGLQPGGSATGRRSVRIEQIDPTSPAVLVDFYTGGAHCCFNSLIYHWQGSGSTPRAVQHDWGDLGYRPLDINGDGVLEFRSADDRFAYAFTNFADSNFPVQIWNLQNGRLVQTTRNFPGEIRADARALKNAYLRNRRTGDVRGILAAYVADEALLGSIDNGWALVNEALARGELDQGFGGPHGAAYIGSLRRFLKTNGYH
jgi:hypothetical protein